MTCFIYIVIHCFVFSNNFSGRAAGPLLLFTCRECTSLNVSLVIWKFEKNVQSANVGPNENHPLVKDRILIHEIDLEMIIIGMAETVKKYFYKFCKKKNIIIGKYLCQSLYFNKVDIFFHSQPSVLRFLKTVISRYHSEVLVYLWELKCRRKFVTVVWSNKIFVRTLITNDLTKKKTRNTYIKQSEK